MQIGNMGVGSGVQGTDLFGTMQTTKKDEEQKLASGDSVSISDEAKYLYAEMQQNGAEIEEGVAKETESGLQDDALATTKQSETVGGSQEGSASGDADAQGKGGGGGGGGSSTASTDSTETLTSIQAEMDAIEMQIAAAEAEAGEGKSNAKIQALEAELAQLQTEYDELAEV